MEFWFHTKAIIYNAEWKILVQKRSDTGKWDLVGGKTEAPERIEDAIVREIREETNITDIAHLKVIHLESSFSAEKNRYFVLILFSCSTMSWSSILSDEHQAQKWVSKDELFTIWLTDYLQTSVESITSLI